MITRRILQASALCIVLSSSLPLASAQDERTTAFSNDAFTDVPPSSPYYSAIEYLRTNNVFKGYLDNTFRPNNRMTRGEFVQLMTTEFILHGRQNDCVLRHTASGSSVVFFPDVPKSSPYAVDICNAKVRDLIHGYPSGFFYPKRPISFIEASKVIVRVFALQMPKTSTSDESWYKIYVQTLVNYNAVPSSINVNTRRGLTRPITRGEVASLIYRLTQAQKNQ